MMRCIALAVLLFVILAPACTFFDEDEPSVPDPSPQQLTPAPTATTSPPSPPITSPVRPSASGYSQPNIIFIMADDLGKNLLPLYDLDESIDLKTPNLDRLAEEGVVFDNAYASPLCIVTRAELITGQYPFNSGMVGHVDDSILNGNLFLDPKYHRSFANPLKDAGYATAMAGKWHGSPGITPGVAHAFGFDKFMRGDPDNTAPPRVNASEDVIYSEDTFPPDLLLQFVVDFINENKDKPFFVYYPMYLVHRPLVATPLKPNASTDAEKLIAMTEYADHLVGKLMDELEELGLRDNTILFFSGDNGTAVVQLHHGGQTIDAGGKGRLTEAGINVPFIVSGGPVVARDRTNALTDFTDVMPTLAEFAGVELSEEYEADGYSLAPFLTGHAQDTPREWIASASAVWPNHLDTAIEGFPLPPSKFGGDRYKWHPHSVGLVVRDERFKVWHYLLGPRALYDLENDPMERVNLWDSNDPDVLQAKQKLNQVRWGELPARPAVVPFDPISIDYGLSAHWQFDEMVDAEGQPHFRDFVGGYRARTETQSDFLQPGKMGSAMAESEAPAEVPYFGAALLRRNFPALTLSAWINLENMSDGDVWHLLRQPSRQQPVTESSVITAGLRRVVNGVEQPPLDTAAGAVASLPSVEIVGSDLPVLVGDSGEITLSATNLNAAHDYIVRADFGGTIKFDPQCGDGTQRIASEVFNGQRSYSETFTVYRCWLSSEPSLMTARLRRVLGGSELPLDTDSRVVAASPSLEIVRNDELPLQVGERGRITVDVSNLNAAHDYIVRVVYGGSLRYDPQCESELEHSTSQVISGKDAHTETFTVYLCQQPSEPWVITAGLRRVVDGEEQPPLDTTAIVVPALPSVEIVRSDLPETIGESGEVTLHATNLNAAHDYTLRLTHGDAISSDPQCENALPYSTSDLIVGQKSHAETFTVYRCGQPSEPTTLTADLRRVASGVEQPPLHTDTSDASAVPILDIIGDDVLPEFVGERGEITLRASNLDPAHDYIVRVDYGRTLRPDSRCAGGFRHNTSDVISGRESHVEIFTLQRCRQPTAPSLVTAELLRVVDREEQPALDAVGIIDMLPSVEIVGNDDLPGLSGERGEVTLRATNLNAAHEYIVRVNYGEAISSDPQCKDGLNQSASEIFSGREAHAETFSVYRCQLSSKPSIMTAELRRVVDGDERPPLHTTTSEVPASPNAVAASPSVEIIEDNLPGRAGESGELSLRLSNLNAAHEYIVKVDYGETLRSEELCKDGFRHNSSEVISGRESHTVVFDVYRCRSSVLDFSINHFGELDLELDGDSISADLSNSAASNSDNWIHVAATWESLPNCNEAVLYINGEQAAQMCMSNDTQRPDPDNKLVIGEGMSGNLDDFAIWRQALKPEHVAALYMLGNSFGYHAAHVDTLFNAPRDYPIEVNGQLWRRTALGPDAKVGELVVDDSNGVTKINFGRSIAVQMDASGG